MMIFPDPFSKFDPHAEYQCPKCHHLMTNFKTEPNYGRSLTMEYGGDWKNEPIDWLMVECPRCSYNTHLIPLDHEGEYP